jgi:hypothetical protein
MAYNFCEIAAIPRLCTVDSGFSRHNIGGMNEAIFFPEGYILSTPSYTFPFDANKAATLDGTIQLKAGATGYRFRFTPDTGQFTEQMKEADDGVYYDQLFAINIPKDRPELIWLKHQMSRSRYTILYRDANGNAKIVRNVRTKFDLDTGKRGEEYNGHIMYARKASPKPALHWTLTPSAALESIFTTSNITFHSYYASIAEGWQPGKTITLPYTPISLESIYAVYNNSLVLIPSTHYTLNGTTVTLTFDDEALSGSPGEIFFFYACNRLTDPIETFEQETFTKTASYSSGETITLSNSVADITNIQIRMNQAAQLRPGIDFTVSGTTVTLLFDSDPTVSAPDIFHVFYITTGTAETLSGWKYYKYFSLSGLNTDDTIELPHTPVANSLLVRYENALQLLPGTDYNLSGNEFEILFDTDSVSKLEFWYAY